MPVTKQALSHFITSSNEIARALDWSKVAGTVLSISIGKGLINLAVASHPERKEAPRSLPSIPHKTEVIKNEKVLSPAVYDELSRIVKDWKVCGMIASWPVQKEGWVGAPCGKVLYTLDQLANPPVGARPLIDANHKVCLWNYSHLHSHEDNWGRDPIYAQVSNKSIHFASLEQYQPPDVAAVDVWNDFCRAMWPELYHYRDNRSTIFNESSSSSHWMNEGKLYTWSHMEETAL